jgi:DNA-binding winged helix-turn-helix (wHTH) protein/TolB-like protein
MERTSTANLEQSPSQYRFGPFTLDVAEKTLWRGDERIAITPKALETLLALVERCGHVVTKDELMERIWPDTFVEEVGLARNVSVLRKVLGANYIETVPKRGYRFTAPVERSPSPPEGESPEGSAVIQRAEQAIAERGHETALTATPLFKREVPSSAGSDLSFIKSKPFLIAMLMTVALLLMTALVLRRSEKQTHEDGAEIAKLRTLAVLPFEMLDARAGDEAFALGAADALVTRLSEVKRLVIRPTGETLERARNTQKITQIGRALGVEAVLIGKIQRVGDRMRVVTQIFRSQDEAIIWAEKFDLKEDDPFDVQDRIAEKVVRTLALALAKEERERLLRRTTADPEAEKSYLLGRHFLNQRTEKATRKAIEHFREAIARDPDYVLAYVGLAESYALLGDLNYAEAPEAFSRARDMALRAIAIDPEFGPAYAVLAFVKHRYDWDWTGAEEDFKRAIALAPNYDMAHYWYALFLMTAGRFDEAKAEMERAVEINPLSIIIVTNGGLPYLFAREYDQAIAHFQRALELDRNYYLAHLRLYETYELMGDDKRAIEAMYAGLVAAGRTEFAEELMRLYRTVGYKAAVKSFLARYPWHLAYANACSYARIGERDLALRSLRQAVERRESRLVYVMQAPDFDRLRADPEYQRLIAELLKRRN